MSNEDVYFANLQAEKKKKEEKEALQRKFEAVSDSQKEQAFSDALGLGFL